ncbi:DUF2062 domain-containing protein [Cytophagaceae bacterium ABcell3]|nr:DUF2062 domain-containing protein [Cytophagaceae bacterium ABcell3]
MKVLITGASGLLGGHITRKMSEAGYDIRLFMRKSSGTEGIKGCFSEIMYGCLTNHKEVNDAVKGCDIVIHVASLTPGAETSFKHYEAVNVHGTINITEAAIQHGVKKMVYISTANTIGPGSLEKPGTELSGFSLFGVGSGYINSKYLAQQYVLEQVEKRGLDAVVINPTFVIGPQDYKQGTSRMILHGLRKIQVVPRGGKNFVPACDVASGVLLALEKGKAGETYLLAGENLTYSAFFDKVNSISGHKPFRIVFPKTVFKALGMAGTLWSRISGKAVSLNFVNASILSLDNYYSGTKAFRELGLKNTSTDTAIGQTIDWLNVMGKTVSPVKSGKSNFLKNMLIKAAKKLTGINDKPEKIAGGFALGTLIGMTPFVGFQMVLAFFLASVFKLNKVAAGIAVFNTNVFTGLFIFSFNYYIGTWLLGFQPTFVFPEQLDMQFAAQIFSTGYETILALFTGGLVTGIPTAFVGYKLLMKFFLKFQVQASSLLSNMHKGHII